MVYILIVSSLFFNYPSCKRKLVLLFNKLESSSPKHTSCSIWLKLAAWFFKFLKYQTLFLTLFSLWTLWKTEPLFEKFKTPSTKHLVSRLIEIGPVVLENMILKHQSLLSVFPDLLPFKGKLDLYLNKLENLKYDSCQVWLKFAKCFWRTRWICEKFMTTTTTRTSNAKIINKIAYFSLWLRWANKHKFRKLYRIAKQMFIFDEIDKATEICKGPFIEQCGETK